MGQRSSRDAQCGTRSEEGVVTVGSHSDLVADENALANRLHSSVLSEPVGVPAEDVDWNQVLSQHREDDWLVRELGLMVGVYSEYTRQHVQEVCAEQQAIHDCIDSLDARAASMVKDFIQSKRHAKDSSSGASMLEQVNRELSQLTEKAMCLEQQIQELQDRSRRLRAAPTPVVSN